MDNSKELTLMLIQLLGTNSVYFQPPDSVTMTYPAIRFELSDISSLYANNRPYISGRQYSLTYIDRRPDSPMIAKLLELPSCSFDRHFKSDNLNHYVFNLYY